MKIISSKYLLDQEKQRRKEQEDRVAIEQQKLLQQQEGEYKARLDKIREGLRLSYVAYSDSRVAKHYLADHGYSNFLPLSSWIGTQGLCCLRDRKACLVFRGTDSLLDTFVDLLFIPWYRPTLHFGFGRSWRSVRTEVRQWLAIHGGKFDSIGLYGHSLGGAIAHVTALDLASDYEIAEVVTFGAPRSSFLFTGKTYDDFQLKSKHQKTLGSVTVRVVNKLDLVSKVPFSWFGYRHVGKLVYLSADGQVYYNEKAHYKRIDEGFLEPVFRLFEQENSALYDASVASQISKPKSLPSSVSGIHNNPLTSGERLLLLYRQAKLYIPLIQVFVQAFFVLIAPFIFLFGTLLYLMRSSKSHLKLEYASYFSDATTQFENDFKIIKNRLAIQGPSPLKTVIGRAIKALALTVLVGGILYVCYWFFTQWTWPLIVDWIYG